MRKVIGLVGLLSLTACANDPALNFVNGRYYIAGDKHCKFSRTISDSQIMCFDKDRKETGYRNALTNDEIQMFAQKQQMDVQALNNSIQRLGDASKTWVTQPNIVTPSPTQYGQSGAITYTQVGNSLIGSNGVTYRQAGSTVLGSDGTSCRVVGSTIICR